MKLPAPVSTRLESARRAVGPLVEPLTGRPFSTLLLCGVGAAVGAAINFHDYPSYYGGLERSFLSTPEFQLFLFLGLVQAMFWGAVSLPVVQLIRAYRGRYGGYRREMLVCSLLFVALLFPTRWVTPSCEYPFPHHEWKTFLMSSIGFVVALGAAYGSLLVNVALARLTHEAGSDADRLRTYLGLRAQLLRLLSISATLLFLATLAQDAKRRAVGALPLPECVPDFGFPRVLLYGLFFTILLALTYIPVFVTLMLTGRNICNSVLPIPSPNDDSWPNWHARRKNLEDLLQLSLVDTLRSVVAVLAPVIASLTSLLRI
jgi:hypothetical protein